MFPPSTHATLNNLRRLFWLRLVMALVLGLAAWIANAMYRIDMPTDILAFAAATIVALNTYTGWRLRYAHPVHALELFIHLLLDMAILSVVFYATGGYSNPFVWMYLLPLVIAAVALPTAYTWGIATLAVACYSSLIFWFEPLSIPSMMMSGMAPDDLQMHHMHHQQSSFNLHLLGMWAGFVVSAGVIAIFIERMGRNLREQERMRAEAQERILESERMLSIGALAANAAHELGTPLATMALLLEEVAEDIPDAGTSIDLMRQQIERCKKILSSIAAEAGELRAEGGEPQTVAHFLQNLMHTWQERHPAMPVQLDCQTTTDAPTIVADRALGQAISNLLDNAAQASPHTISIKADWTVSRLNIHILDDGNGMDTAIMDKLGQPGFTTREHVGGLGLGIFLAKSVIERLDGNLIFATRNGGGTEARISLSLARLRID